MKSFYLPVFMALLVFAAAMIAAVSEYKSSGSLTAGSAALLIAAVAVGVLTQRLFEAEKEIQKLRNISMDKSTEEKDKADDSEEDKQDL